MHRGEDFQIGVPCIAIACPNCDQITCGGARCTWCGHTDLPDDPPAELSDMIESVY